MLDVRLAGVWETVVRMAVGKNDAKFLIHELFELAANFS